MDEEKSIAGVGLGGGVEEEWEVGMKKKAHLRGRWAFEGALGEGGLAAAATTATDDTGDGRVGEALDGGELVVGGEGDEAADAAGAGAEG